MAKESRPNHHFDAQPLAGDELPVETGRPHLRPRFLIPLTLAVLAITAVLMLLLFDHEQQMLNDDMMQIRTSVQNIYEETVSYDAKALESVIDAIQTNGDLRNALADRDRSALLLHSAPLFDKLNQDYEITHFYFHTPEGVNLLRVHAPPRFGDVIDRVSLRRAAETGTQSHAVEMGPLGTFTLRVVSPWYHPTDQRLIGYVELGMEINRVVEKLRSFINKDIYLLVHKTMLDRETWEAGMRLLGHTPDWDQLPDSVLSIHARDRRIPRGLVEELADVGLLNLDSVRAFRNRRGYFRLASVPIADADNQDAAHLVILSDVTEEIGMAYRTVALGTTLSLSVGFALLVFFYWQTGRIERRIKRDETELARLADHDGLTALLNHRACFRHLELEINRSRRYQRPLSLLMIDIDHFKQVNDKYGHLTGDNILRDISALMKAQVRRLDKVCRYGGEEIIIILPETDEPEAWHFAERLRTAVATQPHVVDGGQLLRITISIGVVASNQTELNNAESLIASADFALYAAKKQGRNRTCLFNPDARNRESCKQMPAPAQDNEMSDKIAIDH